jgi:hypothetical protein
MVLARRVGKPVDPADVAAAAAAPAPDTEPEYLVKARSLSWSASPV